MGLHTRSPEFADKLSQLRLKIAPIVHLETGLPPPEFPSNLLSLFLLTESDLDSMAHYYSQVTPDRLTYAYPQTMDWNRPILERPRPGEPPECRLSDYERLRVKMRMFAKFIGMKGAETPRWEMERQMELWGRQMEDWVRREKEEEEVGLEDVRGLECVEREENRDHGLGFD
ncbi:uncharacterized protein EI97DRAFT_454388 [Westerdykella ornata]|uniref:Uncharacterized protein n=1 Tax=Westerdykella ornata TaxID=318751 RepID=A0A6A6JY80_WESOR|nr:uncharacterized protein EI97DRAFT_454388 [Westerdykella ornata]KAF2281174.1 hypothetical protein EI97DRAFT_454388 [Westerdykella ornata]